MSCYSGIFLQFIMFQVQKIKKIKEKVDEGRQNSGQKGRMEVNLAVNTQEESIQSQRQLISHTSLLLLFCLCHLTATTLSLGLEVLIIIFFFFRCKTIMQINNIFNTIHRTQLSSTCQFYNKMNMRSFSYLNIRNKFTVRVSRNMFMMNAPKTRTIFD